MMVCCAKPALLAHGFCEMRTLAIYAHGMNVMWTSIVHDSNLHADTQFVEACLKLYLFKAESSQPIQPLLQGLLAAEVRKSALGDLQIQHYHGLLQRLRPRGPMAGMYASLSHVSKWLSTFW